MVESIILDMYKNTDDNNTLRYLSFLPIHLQIDNNMI